MCQKQLGCSSQCVGLSLYLDDNAKKKVRKKDMASEKVLQEIVNILEDITSDWDLEFGDRIGAETQIVSDLEFESIDVVQFVVQVEKFYDRKDLPFEQLLMAEGRYKDDITVGEVAEFLQTHL